MALTFLKIGHFHPDFAQWQSSPGVTGLLILLSPGEIPGQPGQFVQLCPNFSKT